MKKIFLQVLILLLFTNCGVSADKIKAKMEKALYESYGEEFAISQIGMRSANGKKFYQAKIRPKSKKGDSYYNSVATINVNSFGKLSKFIGDDYGTKKMNDEAEQFLLPKAKEIFGERIRLLPEITYREKGRRYLEAGFKEKLKLVKEDPENKRIEMKLYIYIFDRIDDEKEKEKRREELFLFAKYLNKENLYKHTLVKVFYRDERRLMLSFNEMFYKLKKYGFKKDYFFQMIKVLDKELKDFDEEKLVKKINSYGKNKIEELGNKYFYSGFSLIDVLHNDGEKNLKDIKKVTVEDVEFKLYNHSLINKYLYKGGLNESK